MLWKNIFALTTSLCWIRYNPKRFLAMAWRSSGSSNRNLIENLQGISSVFCDIYRKNKAMVYLHAI